MTVRVEMPGAPRIVLELTPAQGGVWVHALADDNEEVLVRFVSNASLRVGLDDAPYLGGHGAPRLADVAEAARAIVTSTPPLTSDTEPGGEE